ncbi:DUF3693 domain-containing protein [Xanthomonas pisi]|uniref:HTH cro/C1-type domain-containing protein n=1 Tax=Xanthomonas pisi TaxID=56457 RepID=A0A2S7D0E7_9XANT|nr:DUF3693 domain-containing protein [Xanthomonas pisi]PPU67298.1 hypothetical protein XpiCFBP4643_16045 [Xanthomonas pisi]
MDSVNTLLDRCKTVLGVESDNQLAKKMNVGRAAVSRWRSGLSAPDAVSCAAIAGWTGEPLAKVLGIVGEARAISADEKAVWRKLAATAMTLAIGVSLALPVRAEAVVKGFKAPTRLYIMRNDVSGGPSAAALDLALDQILPAQPFP